MHALRARRRAAGDQQRAAPRSALGSDVARVVAGVALVLVGGVVLLVDHDQPQLRDRREDRRARPDADARLALAQAPPLLVALPGCHPRVQDRDRLAEAGAEASHDLRRQRDLRDHHDRPAALRERLLRRAQVDLGLARAGDAVQQHPPRLRRGALRARAAPRAAAPARRAGRAESSGARAAAEPTARWRGGSTRAAPAAAQALGGARRAARGPARGRASSSTRRRCHCASSTSSRRTPGSSDAQRLEQALARRSRSRWPARRRRRAACGGPNGTTSIEPTPTSRASSSPIR